MRLVLLLLGLAMSAGGCQSGQWVESAVGANEAAGRSRVAEADSVRVYPSRDGRARLVHTATPRGPVVVMIAGGDTTAVFDCEPCRHLDVRWLTDDFGRVRAGLGGNDAYADVYAQASSGRVSPWLELTLAADPNAETVLTLDPDAVTLRALWSGHALATWVPDSVSVSDLRRCEPTATLSGRSATLRVDCGGGAREHQVVWTDVPPDRR